MPESQTPTPQAMEAAQKLHDIMHGPEREWCRGTRCDFDDLVAQSHDAYADERIEDSQHPCSFRDALVYVAAERDAAIAKLAATEADRDSWKATTEELGNKRLPTVLEQRAEMRATLAEERVRLLEGALGTLVTAATRAYRQLKGWAPPSTPITITVDRLSEAFEIVSRAKAAADPSKGGKE